MIRSEQRERRAPHFCTCLVGKVVHTQRGPAWRVAVRQVYSCCNLHTDWICPCESFPEDECPRCSEDPKAEGDGSPRRVWEDEDYGTDEDLEKELQVQADAWQEVEEGEGARVRAPQPFLCVQPAWKARRDLSDCWSVVGQMGPSASLELSEVIEEGDDYIRVRLCADVGDLVDDSAGTVFKVAKTDEQGGLDIQVQGAPSVVCLCGSTRFREVFEEEARRLTQEGHVVLTVHVFGHSDPDVDLSAPEKVFLDALHRSKIDLAHRVHVLNVDGYVGESTSAEIQYALGKGRKVTWLEEATGLSKAAAHA